MEIFVLDPTTFANGEVINGLKSVTWTERYRQPGEFKFACPPYDYLRTKLALGTIVSHTDTLCPMMVENHEIVEERGKSPKMIISGRSLDAFALEQRLATGNAFGMVNPATDDAYLYNFLAANSWNQAVSLLSEHIVSSVLNSMDNLPNVSVVNAVTGTENPQNDRSIKRGPLLPAFNGILEAIDAGLKVERPDLAQGVTTLRFTVHKGVDKRTTVRFSWDGGDIDDARYLWSNKAYKNGAYVVGKYRTLVIRPSGPTGFGVRLLWVDASDYDYWPQAEPNASQLAEMDRVLRARGNEALGKQKLTTLLEATLSRSARYIFRKDYNIGDTVYVIGKYGVAAPMRVTEYAEVWDENGESGIPTLSAL